MATEHRERNLMLGVLAGICISNFALFSSPLYIGGLMDGLGFSETQAGLINTFEIGAVAVVCMLFSSFLDRVSLRSLAIAGALMTLTVNLMTFWLDSYPLVLLLRTLAGIGGGFCLAATSGVLSRLADPDRIVGMVLIINTVIMIVLLTIMGFAKSQWMFDGYVGLFSLVVMILIPFLLLLPAQRFAATDADIKANAELDHHFILGCLGVSVLFFFSVIEGSVWSFSERSGAGLGMSAGDIGVLLSLAQVSGLLGAALPAVFGDRIPRLYPVVLGILFMGLAGLLIYQTSSQLIYGLFLCLFTFAFFIAFPYLLGACARLDADGRWAARANGINLLGGAMAPFIAANIIAASDYQTLGIFCFGVALVCLCLAVIFSRQFDRTNLSSIPEFA